MQTKTKQMNEIIITRVFDVPRELAWKAWTDPELYQQWWGPKGYTSPVSKMEVRVGGKYLSAMRGPDGKVIYSAGSYREVKPPERLVVTDSFSDENGNIVPASHYGLPEDFPLEVTVSVTFEDLKGVTLMTLRHEGLPDSMVKMTAAGWEQSFDKLAALLGKLQGETAMGETRLIAEPGKQEAFVTHIFDAPRELVFTMYTDPEMMKRWWSPKGYTTSIEKLELRPGGQWHFIQHDAAGRPYSFHGVYHQVTPPERLVFTFEFDGMPEHVLLETVTFDDVNGKTKVTDQTVYQSVADRDGMLKSGMQEEAPKVMQRIADLLAKAAVV